MKMKTNYPLSILLALSFTIVSFGKNENNDFKDSNFKSSTYNFTNSDTKVDSEVLTDFFNRYSDLKKYQKEVVALYKNRSYGPLWYDNDKINEFGKTLYSKLNSTDQEGLIFDLPYKEEIDKIFDKKAKDKPSKADADMLLSAAYIIYMNRVYVGLDAETAKKTGWMLPKKQLSYDTLLDSLMTQPALLEKNDELLFSQYFKLQEVLKHYREIEKSGVWKPIVAESPYKDLRPDANTPTIGQVRTRLYIMGDLEHDSKSNFYDRELMDGVMKYKLRNGFKPNYILSEDHIKEMNIPLADKINTLMINMERCRWISPKMEKDSEYIIVNVPSFELVYVKNGKPELVSKVFVGSSLTKTTIFNGNIDKVVFSPYWTVPQSIVENELKLKMAADKNYLADHNMEMVNGMVRQKPGPENSLGLVKFIFPNPEDIYMHDTPAKTLFDFEKRTFSHGCINVKKAKELAIAMLKDYPEWTTAKINKAMDGSAETTFKLPKKVPIYITYFTSWVHDSGEISFYQDVYERDSELNNFLFPTESVASN